MEKSNFFPDDASRTKASHHYYVDCLRRLFVAVNSSPLLYIAVPQFHFSIVHTPTDDGKLSTLSEMRLILAGKSTKVRAVFQTSISVFRRSSHKCKCLRRNFMCMWNGFGDRYRSGSGVVSHSLFSYRDIS